MTQIERVARNSKIKHMALDGKTVEEISIFFNMKQIRVQAILRSFNVRACRKSHRLQSEMAQKIISELKAGTRQIEISKKLGVSRQYVNQVKVSFEEQN